MENTFCYGLLSEEEKKVVDTIGESGFEYYYNGMWTPSVKFNSDFTYRRKKDKMSESGIIKFLENSTTPPNTWPKEVQDYALKIQDYCIEKRVKFFEYKTYKWNDTMTLGTLCEKLSSQYPHRLKKGDWSVMSKMTESEIITYLENSTTNPGKWPKEVQDYALKIQKNKSRVFEYEQYNDKWRETFIIQTPCGDWSFYPHRLKKIDSDLVVYINPKGFKCIQFRDSERFISSMLSHELFVAYLDENKQECTANKAKFVRVLNA